jgi:hypothetical protein
LKHQYKMRPAKRSLSPEGPLQRPPYSTFASGLWPLRLLCYASK